MKDSDENQEIVAEAFRKLCYNTIVDQNDRKTFLNGKKNIMNSEAFQDINVAKQSFWIGYFTAFYDNIMLSHIRWNDENTGYIWKGTNKPF